MTVEVLDAFLKLLHHSLWQKPLEDWPELKAGQWVELYTFADKHTVLGTLYDSLNALPKNNGIPTPMLVSWLRTVQLIEKYSKLQADIIKVQKAAWDKRGVEAVLLKGLSVAKMYPVPEHRSSGDIDWYFPTPDDWFRANEAAQQSNCTLVPDSDGDVHYQLGGVVIEHHKKWHDASSGQARAVLKEMDPSTPVAQLMMLNIHILKHALIGGIGLRQFCDLALAYRYYQGQYDPAELESLLAKAGLSKWNELLNAFLVEVLGCEYVQRGNVPDEDLKKLTDVVFDDGNFGLRTSPDGHVKERGALGLIFSAMSRGSFFVRYAPREYMGRIVSLSLGRLKRRMLKY